MSTLGTTAFWRATAERSIKTFAQTLAALLVADGTDLLAADWPGRLSVAGMAALVSILTSIASDAATGDGPSLGGGEVVDEPHDPNEPIGYDGHGSPVFRDCDQ